MSSRLVAGARSVEPGGEFLWYIAWRRREIALPVSCCTGRLSLAVADEAHMPATASPVERRGLRWIAHYC